MKIQPPSQEKQDGFLGGIGLCFVLMLVLAFLFKVLGV
jgi:hypothetical protein